MLSLAELETAVTEFSFWPGWRFSIVNDVHLGASLFILTTQPDRADHTRTVDLGIKSRIPPQAMANVTKLGRWMLWRLEEVMIHEVREGLRYKGELVDDPHAPGRP